MNGYNEIKKVEADIDALIREIYAELHENNYDNIEGWREKLSYYKYRIHAVNTNYDSEIYARKEICFEKVKGTKRTLKLICKII